MTRDIEVLRGWLVICLVIAAVCSTAFPVIWLFSRWWSTLLGRLVMLQGATLALAMDLTAAYHFWPPAQGHIHTVMLVNSIVFGLIAVSSSLLTYTMLRMNYFRYKRNKENQDD